MAVQTPPLADFPNHVRPCFAVDFNQSTIATHTVVAADTHRSILVTGVDLYIAGAQTITFYSSTADTILGSTWEFGGEAYLSWNVFQHGHNIRTSKNQLLGLGLTTAVKVRGVIRYIYLRAQL